MQGYQNQISEDARSSIDNILEQPEIDIESADGVVSRISSAQLPRTVKNSQRPVSGVSAMSKQSMLSKRSTESKFFQKDPGVKEYCMEKLSVLEPFVIQNLQRLSHKMSKMETRIEKKIAVDIKTLDLSHLEMFKEFDEVKLPKIDQSHITLVKDFEKHIEEYEV